MSSPNVWRVASRTNPFTQIGRALLQDMRMSLEAKGALVYMLSLPDNWDFNDGHLCAQFGIGRDKLRRIQRELIELGYVRRKQVRDVASGAFLGVRTLIFETPQAPEESRAADDAGDDAGAMDDDDGAFDRTNESDASHAEDAEAAAPPSTEKPSTGFQGPVEREEDNKHIPPLKAPPAGDGAASGDLASASQASGRREPERAGGPQPSGRREPERAADDDAFWTQRVAADWEGFAKAWPWDGREDRDRARRAYARLSDADRHLATLHAADHLRRCKREDRRPGQARSWIAARGWAAWASGELEHPRERIFVRERTPAFDAWAGRWRAENGNRPMWTPFSRVHGCRGVWRDTLFPPRADGAAEARPPPEDFEIAV